MTTSTKRREERESLVTRQSTALSLSAPRAPPYGSVHRMLLLGEDPSESAALNMADSKNYHREDHHHHHHIRNHIMNLYKRFHLEGRGVRVPHPHLIARPEIGDRATRALGAWMPLSWHNQMRDAGTFRSICDNVVPMSFPFLALAEPRAVVKFLNLTKRCTRIKYGEHKMHVMDIFFPESCTYGEAPRGLIFFVHGGAWGSGLPWFYRLVALPFLEMNLAVAIVGYRTYPDGDVSAQVNDLERAASELSRRYPRLCARRRDPYGHIGTCVMGHSSGAHIVFLMVVERVRRRMEEIVTSTDPIDSKNRTRVFASPSSKHAAGMVIDSFVGISGVYNISHHFDYEAARGVEELSPMKAACGYSRDQFKLNSPAVQLRLLLTTLSECDETLLDYCFPPTLLLHGVEDSTVPFTSTAEAAHLVRSCGITTCNEVYLANTVHQDTVMHLMLGGRSRDGIVDWLNQLSQEKSSAITTVNLVATSKL